MRWELNEFVLDEAVGPTTVFNYEVALKGLDDKPQFYYRGDGLLFAGGDVRLNRENELHEMLKSSGINAQQIIEHLEVCVRSRAERARRQRILSPGSPN